MTTSTKAYGLCAWDECEDPSKSSHTNSKSKYCTVHAQEARDRFMRNRDQAAGERASKYKRFQELWDEASEAGAQAFADVIPVPMHVIERENPFDDSSKIVKRYEPVMDGVCGFAWLSIHPGNSSFAHWAKKNVGASAAYGGGLRTSLPFGRSSQSLTRKEAGASAMAEILREGLKELDPKSKVYSQSRID